jgi:hypothetical protein
MKARTFKVAGSFKRIYPTRYIFIVYVRVITCKSKAMTAVAKKKSGLVARLQRD